MLPCFLASIYLELTRYLLIHAKVNPKKFGQYANSKRKTKSGIGELKTTNSNGEVDTADR
jgi:hypothetical protein